MSTRPIIAFITDFGTRDHYSGAMKGAALGICPEAALVDITHEIAPQDVFGAAIELAATVSAFPGNTIFVAVVDPGVGSSRKAIAVRAGGHTFIGPDNGVLSLAVEQLRAQRSSLPEAIEGAVDAVEAVEIVNPQYARLPVSRTFEGRDRFAPAAAWLAAGTALEGLGPRIDRWHVLRVPVPQRDGDAVGGEVLRVDRFGNLMTNITPRDIATVDRGGVYVQIEDASVPVVETYAAAGEGALCALIGSSGYLEIAVNGGSAAKSLGVGQGATVHVRPVA